VTLLSCVIGLYVIFSPMGLVAGGSVYFGDILLSLAALNVLLWLWWYRRLQREPEATDGGF
jgi:SSS family solute:Na+ symporter